VHLQRPSIWLCATLASSFVFTYTCQQSAGEQHGPTWCSHTCTLLTWLPLHPCGRVGITVPVVWQLCRWCGAPNQLCLTYTSNGAGRLMGLLPNEEEVAEHGINGSGL
jgi:hypothetical protein